MTHPRDHALEIWQAGVDAVLAGPLVRRELVVDGHELVIGEHRWSRNDFDRLIVIGAGKAATAMSAGLLESVGGWLPITGWVNVPEGTEKELDGIHTHPARPAGVNEPTEQGVAGTQEMLRLAEQANDRDLCVVLLSGGGSALMPAPIDGITLDDKLAITRFLSAAGADITELNTVRKHLSSVKGGGLLRACRAGLLITLVLSDVLGDPLDAIASGPTVPDTTSSSDALTVLARFDPERELPDRVYQALEQTRSPSVEIEAPGVCESTTIVLGNNAVAVDAAGLRAEQLGYNHAMQSAAASEGFAEEIGRRLADMTIKMLRADPSAHRTDCLITGGEPTVELAPPDVRGRGGRNQQLVLAAYARLLKANLTDDQWSRFCILSGGTDGEDGPTDAAGAVLDADVHQRAVQQSLVPNEFLSRNDAYTFFAQTGGLIITGPTGTNVCDIRVAVVT